MTICWRQQNLRSAKKVYIYIYIYLYTYIYVYLLIYILILYYIIYIYKYILLYIYIYIYIYNSIIPRVKKNCRYLVKMNNIKTIFKTNEKQMSFTGSLPWRNRIHCFCQVCNFLFHLHFDGQCICTCPCMLNCFYNICNYCCCTRL